MIMTLYIVVINSLNINPRETINGLSAISMANVSAHIMSALNPSHLPDGAGAYFVTGKNQYSSL